MKYKILLIILLTLINFCGFTQKLPAFESKCVVVNDNPKKINYTYCAVYLNHNINYSGNYSGLIDLLLYSDKNTTIVFHLTGNGGFIQGLKPLINSIKNSRATVIMSPIGDIYSSHAFIAISSGNFVATGEGIVMFHTGSGWNMEKPHCWKHGWTKDRGQLAYYKCVENNKKYSKMHHEYLRKLVQPILTTKELKRFDEGFEVIMTIKELEKRMKERKK